MSKDKKPDPIVRTPEEQDKYSHEKKERNLRSSGPLLNKGQMMALANLGSCFNRCATFPYIKNLNMEIKDAVHTIKHGLGKDHDKDLMDELHKKLNELAQIINKIK